MMRMISALILISAVASQAHAQRASGTVVSEGTGSPVAGAIVSVLTGGGRDTTASTLARVDGRFHVTLPARGEVTLLVRSIGFQPVRMPLRGGVDTVLNVTMSRITHTLQPVSVMEMTVCPRNLTGTANIVDIWVEVTNALENTRIARDSVKRRFDYRMYETLTDLKTGETRTLRNDSSSWVAHRPFKVAPPRDLAKDGYVVIEQPTFRNRLQPGSLWYRAPDEMVLLDKSFQESHCFWASYGSGDRDALIGIHFLPVTGININDIRGVFWLDEKSYELKRLEYVYTRIDPRGRNAQKDSIVVLPEVRPSVSNPEPGGVIDFMRLPDGSFIMPVWQIFVNDTWEREGTPDTPLIQPLRGKETGGLVLGISSGRR